MSTTTATSVQGRSVVRGTAEVLLGTTVLAVVLAVVLAALVDAPSDYKPLQLGPVAAATVFGVLVGLGALLLLRRLGRVRLFAPLVVVGTLLSLIGPLSLLGAGQADQPGVSDARALALIPLHLLVGAVVTLVLPRRVR